MSLIPDQPSDYCKKCYDKDEHEEKLECDGENYICPKCNSIYYFDAAHEQFIQC